MQPYCSLCCWSLCIKTLASKYLSMLSSQEKYYLHKPRLLMLPVTPWWLPFHSNSMHQKVPRSMYSIIYINSIHIAESRSFLRLKLRDCSQRSPARSSRKNMRCIQSWRKPTFPHDPYSIEIRMTLGPLFTISALLELRRSSKNLEANISAAIVKREFICPIVKSDLQLVMMILSSKFIAYLT